MDFVQPDPRFGSAYKGAPTTFDELREVASEGAVKISNFNALWRSLETEVDDRNDRILKAGGPQLRNPLRDQTTTEERQAMMREIGRGQTDIAWAQYYRLAQYEADLADLEKSKPDLAQAIQAHEPPSMAVAKRMHEVERRQMAAYDRRGMVSWNFPGSELITGPINIFRDPVGMAAIFVGSVQGQLQSPADIAAILAGNVATSPAKSLLRNAMRNAAANAGTQAFLEPQIQSQRAAVGLESGLKHALGDIAGAAGIGAALDAGIRAPVRAINRARGVEGLGGVLTDAPEPVAPTSRPETAEQPSPVSPLDITLDPELRARAEAGDLDAMREIVSKLDDLKDDPVVRGALAEAEIEARSPVEIEGVDRGDGLRAFTQTILSDLDPQEPRPRLPDPIPEARTALEPERAARLVDEMAGELDRLMRAAQAKLDAIDPRLSHHIDTAIEAGFGEVLPIVEDAARAIAKGENEAAVANRFVRNVLSLANEVGLERLAAQADMHSGLGNPLDMARAIRAIPDLIDTSTPMTEGVRLARSLARLSEQAFGMVERGEADPLLAQIVSDHVANDMHHASVLDGIQKAGITDPVEARRAITDLVPPERDPDAMPLDRGSGIDDPAGPEAKADLERMRAEYAPEMAEHAAKLEARKQQAQAALEAEAEQARLVEMGNKVRSEIEAVMGMIPSDFNVKVFTGISDLPPAAAREVLAANAAAFRDNLVRFTNATTDQERLAARQAMDAAMASRMIEAFADDDTIWIAAYAMNPKGRVAHEVLHALVKSGRITAEELRLLADAARRTGVFDPAREALYRQTYEVRQGVDLARLAEMLDEEAAAHLVEGWDRIKPTLEQAAESVPISAESARIDGIMARLQAFFGSVREAIQRVMGREAKNSANPVTSLLDAILSGEIAKREGVARVMREEDLSAMAVRGDGIMHAMREDLDMSPEARKARAEAMGFDTSRVWYHGTATDFQAFDFIQFGTNTLTQNETPAFFFTSSPKNAAGYAEGWGAEVRDGANVRPVYLKSSNFDEWDVGGGALTPDLLKTAITEAKADGRDGVVFRQAIDMARQVAPGGAASRNAPDVVAVFDPSNIRSINAAFDPRLSDSPNLMYSMRDATGEPKSFDTFAAEARRIRDEHRANRQAGGRPGSGDRDSGARPGQSRFGRALDGGIDPGEPRARSAGGDADQGQLGRGQSDVPRLPVDDRLRAAYIDYAREQFAPAALAERRKAQGWNADAWHGTAAQFDTPDPFRPGRDFGFHVAIGKPDAANERLGFAATVEAKVAAFFHKIFGPVDKLLGGPPTGKPPPPTDGMRVIPLAVKADNPLRLPDLVQWDNPTVWKDKLVTDNSPAWLRTWVRDWVFDNNAYREVSAQALSYNHKFGRDLSAELERRGHDGIIYKNAAEAVGQDSLMLWDAKRIRSAFDAFDDRAKNDAGLRASDSYIEQDIRAIANEVIGERSDVMFAIRDADTGREMRRSVDSLGFYSKLDEVLGSLNPKDKVTLQTLTSKGVKASEIEARGLMELFIPRQGDRTDSASARDVRMNQSISVPVSLLSETAGRNRVGVREVNYGDPDTSDRMLDRRVLAEANNMGYRDDIAGAARSRGMTVDQFRADVRDNTPAPKRKTKWSSYSLDPSNPSYRETVLHLPSTNKPEWLALRARIEELQASGGIRNIAEINRLRDEADALDGTIGESRDFRSGHFPEPNVIGHMMTSMVKHEGRPVYLIDQIQSDWGQKLRDGGVRDEAKYAELKSKLDRLSDQMFSEPAKLWRDQVNSFGKEKGLRTGASNDHIDMVANLKRIGTRQDAIGAQARQLLEDNPIRGVAEEFDLTRAEFRTAEAATPGHPLVNTTDQWVNTTLRRAIRQAAEADAAYIAIPSGDTVLSYNPGDAMGMRGFYGSTEKVVEYDRATIAKAKQWIRDKTGQDPDENWGYSDESNYVYLATSKFGFNPPTVEAKPVEGIVPKNLRKLLEKIDKDAARPIKADQVETPSKGMAGSGFTLFPLTDAVKRSVINDGQVMFALAGTRDGVDPVDPERITLQRRSATAANIMDRKARALDYINDAQKYDIKIAADLKTQRDAVAETYQGKRVVYNIMLDGKPIGEIDANVTGTTASIRFIGSAARDETGAFLDSATLGVPAVRKIREEFRKDFPEVTTFTGDRISGSRRGQQTVMFAFAGEKAKTADLDALSKAKSMELEGKTREDIWALTGWFRGTDTRWRFEIDDSGAVLHPTSKRAMALGEGLKHDELYSAYPWLGQVYGRGYRELNTQLKYLSPTGRVLEGNAGVYRGQWDGIAIDKTLGYADAREAVLHELQHAVQDVERFGFGTDYRSVGDDAYHRSSGEVEARAVEKRMNLTPEQRRSRPPWLDYDVPEDQQIVRFADGSGVSQKSYSSEPPIDGFPTIKGEVMFAIRAYHGSPYDFDRFDMSRIGTGEGAQAFGHGLYFAEEEAIAKHYRNQLSNPQAYIGDRHAGNVGLMSQDSQYDPLHLAAYYLQRNEGDVAKATAEFEKYAKQGLYDRVMVPTADGKYRFDDTLPEMTRYWLKKAETDGYRVEDPGRLYEVRINADPSDFLDWDKPLSQQSEKVRGSVFDIIRKQTAADAASNARTYTSMAAKARVDAKLDRAAKYDDLSRMTPDDYFNDIVRKDPRVSEMISSDKRFEASLREAGIPGIRYLDQGSRSTGEGSRNYVVFDDSIIEIVAKDGKPIEKQEQADILKAMHGEKKESSSGPMFSIRDDATPDEVSRLTSRLSDLAGQSIPDLEPRITAALDAVATLREAAAERGIDEALAPNVVEIAQATATRALIQALDILGPERTARVMEGIQTALADVPADPQAIAQRINQIIDQVYPEDQPRAPANDNQDLGPMSPVEVELHNIERIGQIIELIGVCRG